MDFAVASRILQPIAHRRELIVILRDLRIDVCDGSPIRLRRIDRSARTSDRSGEAA
jgi:hypothetical protein